MYLKFVDINCDQSNSSVNIEWVITNGFDFDIQTENFVFVYNFVQKFCMVTVYKVCSIIAYDITCE